jgi:hypothetical protein
VRGDEIRKGEIKERTDEKEVASIENRRMAVQSAPVYGRQVADT